MSHDQEKNLRNRVKTCLFLKLFCPGLNALYHCKQITPPDVQRPGVFIISRQLKPAGIQLLVVDHQPGVFHVKDLHNGLVSVDENKNRSITNIPMHL